MAVLNENFEILTRRRDWVIIQCDPHSWSRRASFSKDRKKSKHKDAEIYATYIL